MKENLEEEPWKIKARENMNIVGKDIARAREKYWKNKRMEEQQERTIRVFESRYDYNWREYTSTGEEWEDEDW